VCWSDAHSHKSAAKCGDLSLPPLFLSWQQERAVSCCVGECQKLVVQVHWREAVHQATRIDILPHCTAGICLCVGCPGLPCPGGGQSAAVATCGVLIALCRASRSPRLGQWPACEGGAVSSFCTVWESFEACGRVPGHVPVHQATRIDILPPWLHCYLLPVTDNVLWAPWVDTYLGGRVVSSRQQCCTVRENFEAVAPVASFHGRATVHLP
jgi:hypothetical protein